MTFTVTTNLSMGKPDFNHPGGYLLYNAALDTIDSLFGTTSFTAGSVPFSVAGKLSQDNANFSYVSNLLTVGRTVSPSSFNLQRFQRSGVTIGSFGANTTDWFVIRGPNQSDVLRISPTIEGAADRIVFGDPSYVPPSVATTPSTRFRFGDDVQINGVLRLGADVTFANSPIDPDGGLQMGRDITAQAHSLIRFYRQGTEKCRIGMDASDRLALQQGASDTAGLIVGTAGEIYAPAVGTTASAANAFLNSGSTPVNQLLRSTSSRRYKTDIKDLTDWTMIRRLRPITYRSLAEADDKDRQHVGFIAEEVAEVEPRLVHYMDGQPDGVQYERLSVLLVAVVQHLLGRIEALEAR